MAHIQDGIDKEALLKRLKHNPTPKDQLLAAMADPKTPTNPQESKMNRLLRLVGQEGDKGTSAMAVTWSQGKSPTVTASTFPPPAKSSAVPRQP